MIRIAKSSWHYQLFIRYDKYPPHSLCPYFWSVVAMTLCLPAKALSDWIDYRIMLGAEKHYQKQLQRLTIPEKDNRLRTFLNHKWMWRIMGGIAMAAVDIFVVYHGGFPSASLFFWGTTLGFHFIPKLLAKHGTLHVEWEPKPKKPKNPNIAIEYIKAKKARFCPLLEFRDE